MDFPWVEFLDEDACYAKLVGLLHPGDLACPDCGAADRLGAHRRHRAPALDYQCGHRGRVLNAWTGTIPRGMRRRPSRILPILRGIARGTPAAQLARELGCDRMRLLRLRHRLRGHALPGLDRDPPGDATVEADEPYQNAGGERGRARGPRRPAAASGQRAPRPRHLRRRPATDRRSGGPRLG